MAARERETRLGRLVIALTAAATLVILLMLALILGHIGVHGAGRLSWAFLLRSPEEGMRSGGIFPAVFGTVSLVLIMVIAVVPVGVGTAVFLNEYARERWLLTRAVRTAVDNLAGVPPVVFGLFGLGFFVQTLGAGLDRVFYGGRLHFGQPGLLWAALTMAVFTLPVVVVTVEEALRSVPDELRESSLALGATRWHTIRHVVLPRALPGILSGAILAVSRGAGEVVPIMFTGVAYYLPYLPTHLNDQFMELGYHVFVLSTQSPDVEATKPLLYATTLVLLVLTFLLNLIATIIRTLVRRQIRSRV